MESRGTWSVNTFYERRDIGMVAENG